MNKPIYLYYVLLIRLSNIFLTNNTQSHIFHMGTRCDYYIVTNYQEMYWRQECLEMSPDALCTPQPLITVQKEKPLGV